MQYFGAAALPKQFWLTSLFLTLTLKVFFLTFILLANNVFAANQETPSAPLKFCWQFNSLELSEVKPKIRNGRVFLIQNGGQILALNLTNGETLWKSELGGEIIGQIEANDKLIYVASQVAATNEKKALVIIRALSVTTGLTVWQGELPNSAQTSLSLSNNILLAAINESEAAGKIFALVADTGELLWTQKQSSNLSTVLTIVNDSFVFATTDNFLHVLQIGDGRQIQKFSLAHAAQQRISLTNGILLFGDSAGNVSGIRASNGKTLWRTRLGGAAEDILTTKNGVLISSLDDFVYFHNASNGKRLWKKRLASRPLGAAVLSEATVLLNSIGENNSLILSLKKGKTLDQLRLGEETRAIAPPTAAEKFVIQQTNQGLQAFVEFSNVCAAK